MMFVCDECAKENNVDNFYMMLFRSYGPCEMCGKTRSCGDVPCHAIGNNDEGTDDDKEAIHV